MKKGIFFLLLAGTVTANAQSLKDALYGGKLKTDSGTLIRKTDDLSSKIDSNRKKPMELEKNKLIAAARDSSMNKTTAPTDSAATAGADIKVNNTAVKDNNKIWKEFMDSIIVILKEEVLTSKKIKSGTYYLFVEYEIGTDGQVSITNVISTPENSFLQQQVKERLLLTAPQMNPVLDSANKPRKAKKRYNFNITKS
jgi:trehalose/maltose hydrolase-like predicted phosphorylase